MRRTVGYGYRPPADAPSVAMATRVEGGGGLSVETDGGSVAVGRRDDGGMVGKGGGAPQYCWKAE